MIGKNKKTEIILVGAGGIGQVWAAAIHTVPSVRLKFIVDTNLTKARELARQFKGCQAVASLWEIPQDKIIAAAIVATPHAFLAPVSNVLLSRGINVLSEKPGGVNSAEIKKNSALAHTHKLIYSIGFNHRFHAAFKKARAVVNSGAIGPLQFVRARYGFGGRPGYEKEWRFNKKLAGGGELLDQGVHMIDMARSFLGEFINVQGMVGDFFWHGQVEDNAFALLKTKAGQVASIHVSWSNWKWVHSFEIFGEKGYCVIEGLDQRYQGPERLIVGKRHPKLAQPPTEKIYIFKNELKHSSFARELQDFVMAMQKKGIPSVTAHDGYAAMKIVEKIYQQK